MTEARMGYAFRCIVTDGSGNELMTDTVRMIEAAVFEITAQPVDLCGQLPNDSGFLRLRHWARSAQKVLVKATVTDERLKVEDIICQRSALGQIEMNADPVVEALLSRCLRRFLKEFACSHHCGVCDQALGQRFGYSA